MNCARMPDDRRGALSDDAALGGRLRLLQPLRGHRFGHDAILLAAATEAVPGDHVADLGAGVGAAGLALAARAPGVQVVLVEIDPELTALASENVRRNGFDGSVRAVVLDVAADARAYAEAGLQPASVQRVLMNPPFNDPGQHNASPDARRRRAHVAATDGLQIWVDAANRLLAPDGVLTLIWRAERLPEVLARLAPCFGGLAILPVHPRAGKSAIRVLVRAVKGGHAPLALMPGLLLNDDCGRPTDEAEAVLRAGAALPLATR